MHLKYLTTNLTPEYSGKFGNYQQFFGFYRELSGHIGEYPQFFGNPRNLIV